MQVVLLVGGYGKRLKSLTKNIPKPMLSINGTPFLELLVKRFSSYGFRDFLMIEGYKAEVIKNHFRDGSFLRVKIRHYIEDTPHGTGGAIISAKDMLADEFILCFGDVYTEIDYHKMVSFYLKKKVTTIAAYDYFSSTGHFSPTKKNLYVIGDKVLKYSKNCADSKLNMIDAGVAIIPKKILSFLTKKRFSLEEVLYPMLIKNGQLAAYVISAIPYDIGTLRSLQIFRHKMGEIN